MPLYAWKCKTCSAETAVVRTVARIEVPPDEREDEPCSGELHDWERLVSLPQPHQRAPGFGRKGEW